MQSSAEAYSNVVMSIARKILILGRTGQLGHALQAAYQGRAEKVICLDRNACDLSAIPNKLRASLEPYKDVDLIIIAAAYTQVDAAESDAATAHAVNGTAPKIIGEFAADHDIAVLHISTDYVFNGRADVPYKPDHPIDPINVYGQTKAAGEAGVLGSNARCAVVRTSWVYDALGKNFLTTMLRMGQTRTDVSVVSDQFGRPTYAPHLARHLVVFAQGLMARDKAYEGLFHMSGAGIAMSWADFARDIFTVFADELPHCVHVHDIAAKDFPVEAKRPTYSVLDIKDTERVLGYALPDWREGVKAAYRARKT
ncbi:MAG: dTDP-4-dehydrorhamnose reductase [Litorimonas sp.]